MDALLGYGSESQSGSESDVSDSWTSEPSLKRQKSSRCARPGCGDRHQLSAWRLALPTPVLPTPPPAPACSSPPLSRPRSPALPAPSLLPPAGALLDGTYSPPPAHQQRQLEQAVLHQGRSRAFPHVTGNYPTHVFVAGKLALRAAALAAAFLAAACILPSGSRAEHPAWAADGQTNCQTAGTFPACSGHPCRLPGGLRGAAAAAVRPPAQPAAGCCSGQRQSRQRQRWRGLELASGGAWPAVGAAAPPGAAAVPHQPVPHRTAAPAPDRAPGGRPAQAPQVGRHAAAGGSWARARGAARWGGIGWGGLHLFHGRSTSRNGNPM